MSDVFLVTIVRDYGPFALGWVGLFVMLIRELKTRDRLIEVIEANTEAQATLAAKLDALLLMRGEP